MLSCAVGACQNGANYSSAGSGDRCTHIMRGTFVSLTFFLFLDFRKYYLWKEKSLPQSL